jgi:hypothetical protein
VDFVGGTGYNFDQTFDRTTVRPKSSQESAMSTATLSRPVTRPAAQPTRPARPVSLPAGLRLEPARVAPQRPILPPPPPRGWPSRTGQTRTRPTRTRPTRTRLTRRGRLVLLGLCALILLAVISVGRAGSQAATATETGPTLQQTTVQQGETLWAVAQRIAPQNDPREVVAQIRRINHLQTSSLRVGQQLLLPVPSR